MPGRGRWQPSGGGQLQWPVIALNAGLAGVLAVVLLITALNAAALPPPGSPATSYTTLHSPARDSFDVLLDHSDGQAYAALAEDPTMSHSEVFAEGAPQHAFFQQRPVLGYLVWALSFGRPGLIEIAFIIVITLSAAFMAGAATAVVQAVGLGQDERFAILLIVLPGFVVSLYWFGQEALSLACGMTGLALWIKKEPRRVLAGVWFAVGVLTRETIIVVPFVIMVTELVARRRAPRSWLSLWPLLLAPAGYVAWLAVVRYRLGAVAASRGTVGLPFHGVITLYPIWGPMDWIMAAFTFGLSGWAVFRRRDRLLTWIVAAYLVFAAVLDVSWTGWEGFARILLPGAAFAVLALLPVRSGASPVVSAARRSGPRAPAAP